MDRVEIKSLAKEKIKGNLWTIWKPLLLTTIIYGLVVGVSDALVQNLGTVGMIIGAVSSFCATIFFMASDVIILNFTRGEEVSFNAVVECFKNKWLQLFVTSLLVDIFVMLWSLLFVIPGIIKAYAYTMASLIVIDTDLSGTAAIKESMKMMDGYKFDYFVFRLSFIGWVLLTICTLGILGIWLIPYSAVAEVIYYDKLKEKLYGTSTKVKEEITAE